MEATGQSGGHTCPVAEDANNLWVQSGLQWNVNLATYKVRTLAYESRLAELLEELNNVNWDVAGLGEVRRTGEVLLCNRRDTL